MKRITSLPYILVLALIALFGSTIKAQAQVEKATLELILVKASNDESGVDKALSAYAGNLKRLFRFNSYQKIKSSSVSLSVPGSTSVNIGGGQKLKINSKASGEAVAADLEWSAGIHAKLKLSPGKPAVLGGPKIEGGGTYLLIVRMR